MGSAARFILLLGAGVIVMVLYVSSGESPVVLVLSLVTLMAGLLVWARQPWAVSPEHGVHSPGRSDPDPNRRDRRGPGADQRWDDSWRCGHDITWDRRGVNGVAVGDRLPSVTIWNRIDRITVGRHRSPTDDRGPQRRRAIHLELYRPSRPESATSRRPDVWLCVGPDQDPERVAAELASAWRRSVAERRGPNPPAGR